MNNNQINTDFSTTIDSIISEAMETIWGQSSHPFQLDVICWMCNPQYCHVPPSVLLMQDTTSGKSTMMHMLLSIIHSIALAIMQLLALASDQEGKILAANKDSDAIIPYHLKEYCHEDMIMQGIWDM